MGRKNTPQEYAIAVEAMGTGGDGVASCNGASWYVSAAFPGDRGTAVVVSRKDRRLAWKHLAHPSPLRRTPPCPVHHLCGGCDWMAVTESDQERFKTDILERLFAPLCADITFSAHGKPLGYRRTTRLHVQGASVGFFGRRTHRLVPFSGCPVLDDDLNAAAAHLAAHLPAATPSGSEIALASGISGPVAHLRTPSPPSPDCYAQWRALYPSVLAGISLEADGLITPLAGAPEAVLATPRGPVRHPAGSFGQANGDVVAAIGAQIASWLTDAQARSVWELYAGSGTFTAYIPDCTTRIDAVERDAQACAALRSTAASWSHARVAVHCQDAAAARPPKNCDAVVLDPPRIGAAQACTTIGRASIPTAIMISCNPRTAAADVHRLVDSGYRVRAVRGYDMFPQTHHMELAVLLEKS